LAFATRERTSTRSRVRAREDSKLRAGACYPDPVGERESSPPGDRESAPTPRTIEDIAAVGRATRKQPSRGLWMAALVIGGACAIAFAVMLFVDSGTPTHETAPRHTGGFSNGLFIGIALGVVLGWALGRQRRASHSSDKTP